MIRSLLDFLCSKDRFGHTFSVTYKGSDSHKTWFGTILTLIIGLLVLIILTEKTLDMVFMRNPTIQINERPIFKNEIDDAGIVNLSDLDLQIGFVAMESNYKDDEEGVSNYGNHSNRPLPEGVSYANYLVEGYS